MKNHNIIKLYAWFSGVIYSINTIRPHSVSGCLKIDMKHFPHEES